MIPFIIILVLIVVTAIGWASGINKMQEENPEYKGEDFLDWDNNHTENNF
jgi:Tfp pilus assembly protein PilO